MHTFDIIFAIIALIFVIIGIKRGLSGELIRIAAMIIGFIIAFIYYSDLSTTLSFLKVPLQIKDTISFFLLYAISAIIILLIGWVIKKIINLTVLGWADRILGALVGIFKTVLLAWISCLCIASLPVKTLHADFSSSIIYSTYRELPQDFHLRSIISIRDFMYSLLHSNDDSKKLDNKRNKLESIHDTTNIEQSEHETTRKLHNTLRDTTHVIHSGKHDTNRVSYHKKSIK